MVCAGRYTRDWKQCEPSKGIWGKKPCTDSSIGSCERACVTDARAKVYVCVHMPKEVYDIEKMCVHAAEDAGSSAAEIEYCSLCCVLVDCTRCSEYFVQLFEAWTWLVCACLFEAVCDVTTVPSHFIKGEFFRYFTGGGGGIWLWRMAEKKTTTKWSKQRLSWCSLEHVQ